MKCRFFALILSLITGPVTAYANDAGVSGVGGRWRLMPGESKSVAMESEVVRLKVLPNFSYHVAADFLFVNSGPATTVKMGFPESAGGVDVGPKDRGTDYHHFRTSVDGRPVKVRRIVTSEDSGSIEALWIKDVRFGAGQRRKVRVEYDSFPGGSSMPHTCWVSYNFTGGNWKGLVKKSTLIVDFSAPGAYFVGYTYPEKFPPVFKRSGRFFIYTWRNWQAEGAFEFHYQKTLLNFLHSPTEKKQWPVSAPNFFPIKITVPGLRPDDSSLEQSVSGIQRAGRVYVSIDDWKEWLETKKHGQIAWNVKEQSRIIEYKGRRMSLKLNKNSDVVRANRFGETVLFVPISVLQKGVGANFQVSVKRHSIIFS